LPLVVPITVFEFNVSDEKYHLKQNAAIAPKIIFQKMRCSTNVTRKIHLIRRSSHYCGIPYAILSLIYRRFGSTLHLHPTAHPSSSAVSL